MKRASNDEQLCRRKEFVCKLYDVIKDLDQSLKTDCNRGGQRFIRENANPFTPKQPKMKPENPSACACPPMGCCEDSLQFKLSRIPNYPGLEGSQGAPAHEVRTEEPSEFHWHKGFHNNGCWSGHEHEVCPRSVGCPSQGPQEYQGHQGDQENLCIPRHKQGVQSHQQQENMCIPRHQGVHQSHQGPQGFQGVQSHQQQGNQCSPHHQGVQSHQGYQHQGNQCFQGPQGYQHQGQQHQGNQCLQAPHLPQGFRIPSCPEEAMAMGCFVAKAA